MKIKDDVTLQDVRRYGDLLDRKDWIYNRQNHSIQDWKYGDENLRIKMVDGECIYIEKLDKQFQFFLLYFCVYSIQKLTF